MKIYNKLVRDDIPKIIKEDNRTPISYILDDDKDYERELNRKLQEEVDEYIKSGDVMELVDLGEVMHAILELRNVSIDKYQELRKEKLEQRGSFKKRVFLEKTYMNILKLPIRPVKIVLIIPYK
jgi:predicted house-cleaning noncanonical NTP pyrophosphatase (MazG superfamily)